MAVLIDSSTLIEYERGRLDLDQEIAARHRGERVLLSVICVSELLHGVHRAVSAQIRARRSRFAEDLISRFVSVPVDLAVARVRAQLMADLAATGRPIRINDSWIAATCLTHQYTSRPPMCGNSPMYQISRSKSGDGELPGVRPSCVHRLAACAGIILLIPCAGCWSGSLARSSSFAYKHPSVQWVYQTGGSVGWFLWVPVPAQHGIYDLQRSGASLSFAEDYPGDMIWQPFQPHVVLDVRTGRPRLSAQRKSCVTRAQFTEFHRGDQGEHIWLTDRFEFLPSSDGAELAMRARGSDREPTRLLGALPGTQLIPTEVLDTPPLLFLNLGTQLACIDCSRIPELGAIISGASRF